MNDSERRLIQFVCDGDMRNAQKAVKIILNSISSKKDEQFKENMFRKLESKREFIELPYNLQHLLIAEDTEEFPEARFLLRNEEKSITQKIVAIYKASEKLNEIGIPYLPALMLYGQSGCGKTMLARYIAHKAKLPFLRIQFSSLVDSHLGQTQSNLARIFDYVRTAPCVLCFDEIDAVGMAVFKIIHCKVSSLRKRQIQGACQLVQVDAALFGEVLCHRPELRFVFALNQAQPLHDGGALPTQLLDKTHRVLPGAS